ncbi:MAG: pitrilysin family protein, partial [Candidatus Babeliales bacterium]|nr:pitrilysin family protein [Candidatus Babeliales bacterium]
ILSNGLTILVKPNHQIPKVSVQLWYNVGSKDEKSGEKGIAHLIEHMIFKGTQELSESDINLITHKLSGYCNAFTSFDYTGYLFEFPSHHWQESLPVMADCMRNCTFKEEFLNSELKAVIQELKMYNDDYPSTLTEEMIMSSFTGHPYQYPVIGYKHDLWSLVRDNLVNFYKKHYIPNNATLVVVGDVKPEEVFELAEKSFGKIEPDWNYKKEEFYLPRDLTSKSVTVYRDVKQPQVMVSYLVPGSREKVDYAIDVISSVLGSGRSSRLYKQLLDEKQLVTDIETFSYDLFDQGVFFVTFTPKHEKDIDEIVSIIKHEIKILVQNGTTDEEIQRACKKAESEYLSLLEDNEKQAYIIGKSYLANGDENYIYNYLSGNNPELKNTIQKILKDCFRSSSANIGKLLPINKEDKDRWLELQKISDTEDARVLSKKARESLVEEGLKVHEIQIKEQKDFKFPKYEVFHLSNGLEVLAYDNPGLPKIDMILEFKSKYFYDPEEKQGLTNFVSAILLEGTNKFTSTELSDIVESYGMSLDSSPGYVSMGTLSQDLPKGLDILSDILVNSNFNEESFEKVKELITSDLKHYWDSPSQFADYLIRQQIYKNHPYSKNVLGSLESVASFTQDELMEYYKKIITPQGARLAIVGDLSKYNLHELLEEKLGTWQGPKVESMEFPIVEPTISNEVNHYITRDQVVLCFAGLTVKRTDADYDKLLLFDQIFCGGSMSSRLFELREQSGLFYTIGGSLITRAEHQPGMVIIKTIVSLDRLEEAEQKIKETIDIAHHDITPEEFEAAHNAVANSLVDNFETNNKIASAFLFLRRYDYPVDFFDKRAEQLSKITVDEVKQSVKNILSSKKLLKLRIGRIQ